MAVDASEVTAQPTEGQVAEPQVAAEPAEVSGQGEQERENPGWFRRLFGRRDDGQDGKPVSAADQEPGGAEAKADEAKPVQAKSEDEIEREVQSRLDRALAKQTWDNAVEAANRGDTSGLRKLAAQGHGPAKKELARRGETFELGEAEAERLRQEDDGEAAGSVIKGVVESVDRAVFGPLWKFIPESGHAELREAFQKAGDPMKGREAIVERAFKLHDKHVREQFENELTERIKTDPVLRKKVFAAVRDMPDFDEPDLVSAVSGSGSFNPDEFIRDLLGKGNRRG